MERKTVTKSDTQDWRKQVIKRTLIYTSVQGKESDKGAY